MSTTELERAVAALVESERSEALARAATRRAREGLEMAAHTDAVEQRAEQVDQRVASLESGLIAKAVGRPWYDGLMAHQWAGMRFGAGAERFVLGDDPGLGKTRTSIGWLDLIGARKVIVVCLAEVAAQFAGEIEEVAPHRRVSVLAGLSVKARDRVLEAVEGDDEGVVVVNFETFHRQNGVLDRLIAWRADTVVVDEAHQLKARGTRRNLERLVLAENVGDEPRSQMVLDRYLAGRSVKHLCLTTGTPILNSPDDIFPLLHLIDPILFKSLAAFNRAYTVENHAARRLEFKPGGLHRLKGLLSAFYIARTYEDAGIVLPPSTHRVVRVDVTPEDYPKQRKVIDDLTTTARIVLSDGSEHNVMSLLALVMRKRQANVWPAGIEIKDMNPDSPAYGAVIFSVGDDVQESAKMDAVIAGIEEHRGQRQVVFSQFKTALAELERRLAGRGVAVARLDGDTPARLREAIREDFYRPVGEPRWDVLLANYKTGGVGLNLTRATVVHEMDEEWTPGKRDQARGRVHRVGQTQETEVFTYRVPQSVDTYMANIVRGKERMIQSFEDAVLERNSIEDLLKRALVS